MEPREQTYDRSEFIDTSTGNVVSRQSVLCGSQHIHLSGKTIIMPEAVIRGDLSQVVMGRYCVIGRGSVLRPAYKRFKGGFSFFPLNVGEHVAIGADCVVEAATIGSNVQIGDGVVIGQRCVLKDCCEILDGAVLPPDTVVPPFMVVGGNPGVVLGELPESTPQEFRERVVERYRHFRPGS